MGLEETEATLNEVYFTVGLLPQYRGATLLPNKGRLIDQVDVTTPIVDLV